MTAYKCMDEKLVPFPLSIDSQVGIPIKAIDKAGLPKPTVARLSRLFTLKQSLVSKKLALTT